MNLKIKAYYLIFIFFFISSHAQIKLISEKIENYTQNVTYKYTPKYSIIENEGPNQFEIENFWGESNQEEFALPKIELVIAIVNNMQPKLDFIILEDIIIDAIPSFSAKYKLLNNGKLYYEKNTKTSNLIEQRILPRYKLNGYLNVDGNECLHLTVYPFRYLGEESKTSLISEFQIKLTYSNPVKDYALLSEPSRRFISNKLVNKNYKKLNLITQDTTGNWIDYSLTYVKMGVAKDGIYRLEYDQLINFIPNLLSINPKSFKLINRGQEVPIFVHNENDNVFNENDFIEFLGERNMGGNHRLINDFGEPYNEYLGRYTDTTIYWLTWGGENGLRVETTNNNAIATQDTLDYYYELIHFEKNNWFDFSMADLVRRELPFWYENKTWHNFSLSVGTRISNYSVSDVYPNKEFYVSSKVMGFASSLLNDAHLLAISNNSSSLQDSGYINKYDRKLLQGTYNSNSLNNGSNTLKLHSFETGSFPNTVIMDWYEVEYPRYLNLSEDSLIFRFSQLPNQNLFYNIKLQNVQSDSIIVWRRESNSFKRFHLGSENAEIIFSDSINGSIKFFASKTEKIISPKIYLSKNFQNLRNPNNQADYLIVTHKDFLQKSIEYSNMITSYYGINTKVIDVEEIFDEFDYGYFNPEVIKDFLISTHEYWQNPYPEYVFLIGGATYDYHGNKAKFLGLPPKFNYVPSFGASVSDNWFVTWDSTGAYIPQMKIGRIPINNIEEFERYRQKHENYLTQSYNEWNKRYMFFSGGVGTNQSELDLLRNVNNQITAESLTPPPIGGIYTHFYKTINPTTNFGPYSQNQIDSVISKGAVFISYLGHSGTRIWDNSITEPIQLKNNVNRYPLITDFGCSTARFAEPDVTSFSELFTLSSDGQAIGYIGNSSLGFLSTSTTVPKHFYNFMLQDSIYNIVEALNSAKNYLIQNFGNSNVNKLFTLTNSYIGDPIIRLQIPTKSDLSFKSNSIDVSEDNITDLMDSVHINLSYYNFGRVDLDSFSIRIDSKYSDSLNISYVLRRELPTYTDQLVLSIPTLGKPGEHSLIAKIDFQNEINELHEDNNEYQFTFNVASSDIRNRTLNAQSNSIDSSIVFINPTSKPAGDFFDLEFSENSNFQNPILLQMSYDTLITSFYNTGILQNNKRYWLRTRSLDALEYSPVSTLLVNGLDGLFFFDSVSYSESTLNNLVYSENSIEVSDAQNIFHVESAGFNDGNYAIIKKNDQNLIPEITIKGHHICTFDKNTLDFLEYRRYKLNDGAQIVQNYISFIDSLSGNEIVIIAIGNDGSQGLTQELRQKIKLLGSVLIDNVGFIDSWAMVGYKGAPPGTILEDFSNTGDGSVVLDTTMVRKNLGGFLHTREYHPINKLNFIKSEIEGITDGEIKFTPIGINGGIQDTLTSLTLNNQLYQIDNSDYKRYKFLFDFNLNSDGTSPKLKSLLLNYNLPPELALNYQVVSVSQDSIDQGDPIDLDFYIYNVGESAADSFNVLVNLVKPDNSKKMLLDTLVTSIDSMGRAKFNLAYQSNLLDGFGNMAFEIQADTSNKILELYKDNNYFKIPFYVIKDSVTSITSANVAVTFDGVDIYEGDFVAPSPVIAVDLDYQPMFPATDTNSVRIYIDGRRYYHSNLDTVQFDSANRNVTYKVKPLLDDGEHLLKIEGHELIGNLEGSPGYEKTFMVSSEAKVLYVYNYPNPFADDTYFTFKLTQVPDKIDIKIYTITGRLIKEIIKTAADFGPDFNFNRIYWDGRDEDGDRIANGVYFYKVTMKAGDKSQSITQKMAVLR